MNKRFSLIIKGTILALMLTVMFSLLIAAAVYFFDVSDRLLSTLTFAIAVLSCLSGAYAVSKSIGSKGLLTGGSLGIVYYIILAIISLILKKDFSFTAHALIMFVCSITSGMLGGVLGIPR